MRYPCYILILLSLCCRIDLFAQLPEQRTLSGLRAATYTPSAEKSTYLLTDPGRQGLFSYAPEDKISADDSAMTIVTASGARFRRVIETGILNAQWFGATGNGSTDDWYALQKGINYILSNPNTGRTLYLPPGTYRITRPLIIARTAGTSYKQSSINLIGPANSKSLSAGMANIVPTYTNTFAIGVQLGKGVLIKDLQITGRFSFPNKLTDVQVDTLSASEWTDGVCRNNPKSPYAGIVIDPFCDSTVFEDHADMYPGLHPYYLPHISRGGSTAVQVVGCSIRNFIVGFMLTPSNQQNGDLIDVIDCDISSNKVGYAMGQAQSKECHVERLKCWGPTHTLFDNVNYGFRHGDGANIPLVDGVNIAGQVKQLCWVQAASFGGVFRNVYAEGLFRIGFVGGMATVSFEDCQLNFATIDPTAPYPDFFVLGSGASFHSCMLRLYTGAIGSRLILSGSNNYYEGGIMNEPPVAVNLDENIVFPSPSFKNVAMYYSGGILGTQHFSPFRANLLFGSNGFGTDPVYPDNVYNFRDADYGADVLYKLTYQGSYERTARLSGTSVLHIDRFRGSGFFKLSSPSDLGILKEGDMLLTSGLHYTDQFTNITAATYPVGFIASIGHDTVYLRNIAVGIRNGMKLPLWMDYYVNEDPPFTGDIAAGSNTITHVQGTFPAVGKRPDIPMLPLGSYVTKVNQSAGTISFSNAAGPGRSYTDYTFMNGYPSIDMFSSYDPKYLLGLHKTFPGGADFFRFTVSDINTHEREYLLTGAISEHYKILNSNFKGDTSLHPFKYVPVFNLPVNR